MIATRAGRRHLLALAVGLAGCGGAGGPSEVIEEPAPCQSAEVGYPEPPSGDEPRFVHDPEIAQQGDTYYVLSTNDGIPIRKSKDLLSWTQVGKVYPGSLPGWAATSVPGVESAWAPGLKYWDGKWHLYYSLSTFGSPRSAIGQATSVTLDPTSTSYGWTDHGKVVESFSGYDHNAIDAAVVEDASGGLWLTWGSWGGGIKLRALDRSTGMLSRTDTTRYTLAARPAEKAVEGAYIIRRGGYYYLFISFDNCCRGTQSNYNVRVGRSANVTGPYVDREGAPLSTGGGTPVLTGYGRWYGPGHASVLEKGVDHLLVHHYYDGADAGTPRLQIRPLLWDEQGWPVAGLPYDGRNGAGAPPTQPALAGRWGYWAGADGATRVELKADGSVQACDRSGTWSYDAPMLTVQWQAAPGLAARTDRLVLAADANSFAGRAPDRRIVRGYRLPAGQ